MSIFRSMAFMGLVFSAAVYSAETPAKQVIMTDSVVLDNFKDEYLDESNRPTFGAVHNLVSLGTYYGGDGYWYYFNDDGGASVTTATGDAIVTDNSNLVTDSMLAVKISAISDGDKDGNKYAGVGFTLGASDKDHPINDDFFDLSKATKINIKAKGTGSVRFRIETYDILTGENKTWGWYGKNLKLTSDWTTFSFPVDSMLPEAGSQAARGKWTFKAHGASKCNKVAFAVAADYDATLYVDYITLSGIKWSDLGWSSAVISPKTFKNANMFSVNSSSIAFKLVQPENLTVSLANILGKNVRTLFTGYTNTKSISLNNENLPSGRYLVHISGKNVNYSQPIVIVK